MVSLTGGEPFLRADLARDRAHRGRAPLSAPHHARMAGHAREGARGLGGGPGRRDRAPAPRPSPIGTTRRPACRARTRARWRRSPRLPRERAAGDAAREREGPGGVGGGPRRPGGAAGRDLGSRRVRHRRARLPAGRPGDRAVRASPGPEAGATATSAAARATSRASTKRWPPASAGARPGGPSSTSTIAGASRNASSSRREADRVGDLTRESWSEIGPRLRGVSDANACRSCWYASRGEVEGLYSARGLVAALPALVRS